MTATMNGAARRVAVVGPCSSEFVAVDKYLLADAARDIRIVYHLAYGVIEHGRDAELTERAMFTVRDLLDKVASTVGAFIDDDTEGGQ